VTVDLAARGIRLVLLDIEGTTTPIRFVDEVLFPYVREHLAEWWGDLDVRTRRDVLARLASEHAADRASAEPVPDWLTSSDGDTDSSARAYVEWLMDRDRKSPALKHVQGLVWERGYQAGELHGVVYADVPVALRRWRERGVNVAIYSSGSELAQRRLFASTAYGDLTPLIVAFFDTAVGPKRSPESYTRIASALNRRPDEVLFVSDVAAELDAAARAGCAGILSVRPGNPPQDQAAFGAVQSFDEIL
jgi:enolase-phosphatase E1